MRFIYLRQEPAVQHPHAHTVPGKENMNPSCNVILTGALGWHKEALRNQIN